MAILSFPTTRKIQCPLLIEANHLESLDRIFDRHLPQMQEEKIRGVAEEASQMVRQGLRKHYIKEEKAAASEAEYKQELANSSKYRESRVVSIYLTKGREIIATNFSEAMDQPVGEDELPVGFSAHMRVGEITARVSAVGHWHKEMTVQVDPNDNEVAQSLFGALSNWASGIEAPKWQQKWLENKWIASGLLLIWLVAGGMFIPFGNWNEAGKNAAKEEAKKLLAAGGINTDNEHRAIELLLAIQSDYRPPSISTPPLGLKYWSYLFLGALILLAVTIYPDLCIGLWKGKHRLHHWRLWMRTLTLAVPGLLATYLFIPWLLHWLKLAPPNP